LNSTSVGQETMPPYPAVPVTPPAPHLRELFKPCFVDVQSGRRAGSILSLFQAGTPYELDFPALNVFLRTGMFIGDLTPFRFVRATLPDIPVVPRTTMDREQAIDAYIELFRQSMLRCLSSHEGKPYVMGLSGGRDSRHILLEAVRARRKPAYSYTVDLAHSPDECLLARTVAERLGVQHKVVPATYDMATEFKKNTLTDFCSLQHGWILGARQVLSQFQQSYDGIGGDILSGQPARVDSRKVALVEEGRIEELAELLVSSGPLYLVKNPALFPRREEAVALVHAEISRHLDAVNPVKSFYFWNRTRRDIAESAFALLVSPGQQVHAPYLDSDLFQLLASLPAQMTIDRRLHTDAMHKAFPEFANIGFASSSQVPRAFHRRLALDALGHLRSRRPGLLNKARATVGLLRAIVQPGHAGDARPIALRAVYLTQIWDPLEKGQS